MNDWEFPYVAGVPVHSGFIRWWVWVHVGGGAHCCVAMFCLCVCSLFLHCIDCRLLLYCWLGLFVYCAKLVLSLYCGCSLQGTCTVDWSYIMYCHSSTVSVLCYLLYVRTGLFLLWWCVLHCCILPLFVWSFLAGKSFPVVLSWGGSLSFWWLVGLLVGVGWLGLFCGYWSFSKASVILLGAMLYRHITCC